jgi:hypothetical protein
MRRDEVPVAATAPVGASVDQSDRASTYRAYSTVRTSRSTVTLISPG